MKRGRLELDWIDLDVRATCDGEARVANSLIGALLRGEARLTGTAAAPVLTGSVEAVSGEVRIHSGVFFPLAPEPHALRLDIPAGEGAEPMIEGRSSMSAGATKVFLDVTGPLASPSMRLHSDPPMSREDLVALVLFGQTAGRPGEAGAVLETAAMRMAQTLITDHFPLPEPEATRFGRFRMGLAADSGPVPIADDDLQLGQSSISDRGTVIRTEFTLTDDISVVTELDERGVRADMQFHFRWPRRKRAAASRPSRPPVWPFGGLWREPNGEGRSSLRSRSRITGNQQLPTETIMHVLERQFRHMESGTWDEAHLSDAKYRIRRLYGEKGYYFVDVDSGLEGDTPSFAKATEGSVLRSSAGAKGDTAVFEVREGPLVRMGTVAFEGNERVTTEELHKALFTESVRGRVSLFSSASPFSRRALNAQVDSLVWYCRRKGFLDATAAEPVLRYSPAKKRMDITHRITEGPRYTLGAALFERASEEDLAGLEALVRPRVGRPLDHAAGSIIAARVRDYYRDRGRPRAYCRPELSVVKVEGGSSATGNLRLEVRPGPKVRIGEVKVSGNVKARASFVRRAVSGAGLEAGAPLVASELRAAEKSLIATQLFRSARVSPVGLEVDPALIAPGGADLILDVEVRVEEAPHAELVLSGGWGSHDNVRGGIDLATRNAFGRGEVLRTGADVSERGYVVRTEAAFPVLSRGKPRLKIAGVTESREEKSYDINYSGFLPTVSWRPSRGTELKLGARYESARTENLKVDPAKAGLLEFRNVVPSVSFMIDGRDSRSNPSRGVLLTCTLDASLGALTAGAASDVAYTRFSTLAAGYVPFHRNLVLALSARCGVIEPREDTTDIPIALRYFGGGVGSVRGIPDRELGPKDTLSPFYPLGGECLATFQAELRFRMWRGLHGAAFADRGDVLARAADLKWPEMRTCVGWGLRYLTRAGFIAFDVGYNQRPEPGEPSSIMYLLFGLPF